MSKKSKNNKVMDVLRWITLLPVVCCAWYGVSVCVLWVLLKLNLLAKYFILSEVISTAFICCVLFFVTKMYAPAYKKTTAWIVVAVFCLWQIALFYSLRHMAY